jgi:hypothetical protein
MRNLDVDDESGLFSLPQLGLSTCCCYMCNSQCIQKVIALI